MSEFNQVEEWMRRYNMQGRRDVGPLYTESHAHARSLELQQADLKKAYDYWKDFSYSAPAYVGGGSVFGFDVMPLLRWLLWIGFALTLIAVLTFLVVGTAGLQILEAVHKSNGRLQPEHYEALNPRAAALADQPGEVKLDIEALNNGTFFGKSRYAFTQAQRDQIIASFIEVIRGDIDLRSIPSSQLADQQRLYNRYLFYASSQGDLVARSEGDSLEQLMIVASFQRIIYVVRGEGMELIQNLQQYINTRDGQM
ncbi:MAG: hypothetical protein DDT34_02250 [Firmicutes bacterium]|nr:hypothetical protein [Bacillota bacterium]